MREKRRARGQSLHAGNIMNHWKRGLAYSTYCLAALALVGWEAWRKHKLCISLVSITTSRIHTDSDTACQCSTVGPHPACSCQSSVLAERTAACQSDRPREGSGPPQERLVICQLDGTKPSPVAPALEPSLTTHCVPLLGGSLLNALHVIYCADAGFESGYD